MKNEDVIIIVSETIKDFLKIQGFTEDINADSRLVGSESMLDSLGLVNVIVDLESKFLEQGHEISIMSEKAMSMKVSPFQSVKTLSDFIFEQLN